MENFEEQLRSDLHQYLLSMQEVDRKPAYLPACSGAVVSASLMPI